VKLLLDNGVPRSTVDILLTDGFDAVHTGQIGLSNAADQAILEHATSE